MQSIYKYPLEIVGKQQLLLPMGAEVLSVGNQNEILSLWALVSPEEESLPYDITIIGTGKELSDEAVAGLRAQNFYGTASMAGGQLIWHVFGTAPKLKGAG